MNVLEMQNVSFSSSTSKIINDVNLSIQEGTITEIYGASGGGKSVLLKLLAGILVPSSGRVLYYGKDIENMSHTEDLKFRKNCAFVFQNSALWSNQTIGQNIMLPLQIHFPKMNAEERNERIKKICQKVEYTKSLNLRPSDISDGEQKKVALARAMVIEPKVLFLDECTLSLDDHSAEVVMAGLHEYVDSGNTIIYISHNEKFRWEFPGYMYELYDGQAILHEIDLDDLR